ncbi:MAG: hypothetical protein L0I24_25450 [Pseudonocardia sp.]|nr:hypothetical protein [Pseudonocardia sp.]
MTTQRTVVAVAGAEKLLDDATARLDAGEEPRDLAYWLRGAADTLDLRDAAAAARAGGRGVLLAAPGEGPVLGLRWMPPLVPTGIHDHLTWGALLVVQGRDRYQRFDRDGDGGVTLGCAHCLAAGDVLWWDAPPGDVHRQCGLDGGALELLLSGAPPQAPRITTFADPESAGGIAGDLASAFHDAYLRGDTGPLERWYDDDVLADVFVPQWRFQVRGKADVLGALAAGELGLPGHRLTRFRSVPTDDGVVVEVGVRSRVDGGEQLWQTLHRARLRRGRIVEHVVYCTGHQDPATIERQVTEAWLSRP